MKTKKNLLVACFVGLALTFGIAGASIAGLAPGTGIVDSKHDMRGYAEANGGARDQFERVCAYCHTPHHAVEDLDADYMPLWSRTVTSEVFVEYDSATFDGYSEMALDDFGFPDPVAGPSRLCMGCHDGAVAIDAYYGDPGTALMVEGDAFLEIGVGLNGDLTNDHPIGFNYLNVASADDEINPATSTFSGGAQVADVLYEGSIMTCATCHDVHNGPTVNEAWFLYGLQEDSEFCTTCHAK
ncbi:Doubled CXXCH motif (Paired_CXXCH_1) [Malonomonas rubra DSM 5091]|uniref:Doubled CXXCH motif (Paired_CXXCH_1) n=1 Tax=Malonomonas rubra DSM 5091 TaxID=1122189 RepID=A0A1M6DV81_MALRU|nr:cytochrome c3 family protein [Malonomonas rubra]SHI77156.1 Doubled CXXCH motif (Paired_CXXCH_1) [Malonomonas rubra DSM 5091]